MKNLSFDDGRKSFTVNDDPARVIRFNPADPEIINRLLDAQQTLKDYQVPEGIELNRDGSVKDDMELGAAYVAEFTSKMRETFNGIFNADVYDTIFDGQSPLCIPNEDYLFVGVLSGLIELMKPAFEEYERKSRQMEKYLGDV